MKKSTVCSLFVALVAFAVVACGPSTKGETQKWENSQKECAEAITKYPPFKNVLLAKQAAAKKIWAEAEKIKEEDAQIKKMQQANAKFDELLNQFTQIKYKSESVQEKIDKLVRLRLSGLNHTSRNRAVRDARRTLSDANIKLTGATFANEAEAKAITGGVISKLISEQSKLDRVIKKVSPEKAKKKKKKKK